MYETSISEVSNHNTGKDGKIDNIPWRPFDHGGLRGKYRTIVIVALEFVNFINDDY